MTTPTAKKAVMVPTRVAPSRSTDNGMKGSSAVVAWQPLQHVVGEQKGQSTERQIEPENPRPMQMLRNEPAQDGAAHGRYDEGRRRVGLIPRTIAGRSNVADDGLYQRH